MKNILGIYLFCSFLQGTKNRMRKNEINIDNENGNCCEALGDNFPHVFITPSIRIFN